MTMVVGKLDFKENVKANELEKYVSFYINNKLIFVDSFQLLSYSFDSLVKNLGKDDFKFWNQELSNRYEFFSSLKDECISGKYYLSAIDVWNVFKLNTMGDYQNIYLKADALLLADVFEEFINTYLEYYGLDPCNYFSSSGLS